MDWLDAFSTVYELVGTDAVVAGGACSRAWNMLPYESSCDIDVWVPRDYQWDILNGRINLAPPETPIIWISTRIEDYPDVDKVCEVRRYFVSSIRKQIDVVRLDIDDHLFNPIAVTNTFDLNVSRYYFNWKNMMIMNDDHHQDEIAVYKINDGTTFSRLFTRVNKYRNIYPEKGVTFRLRPDTIIDAKTENLISNIPF